MTVKRRSALEKSIRGACFSPLNAAFTRSFVSSTEDTPNVTVPISSLTSSNVSPEISQKGVNGGEGIGYFSSVNVFVVPFSGLVVIAQHTPILNYIGQTILEGMQRPLYGLRHLPDHKLNEGILTNALPVSHDRSRLHSTKCTSVIAFLSTYLTRFCGALS